MHLDTSPWHTRRHSGDACRLHQHMSNQGQWSAVGACPCPSVDCNTRCQLSQWSTTRAYRCLRGVRLTSPTVVLHLHLGAGLSVQGMAIAHSIPHNIQHRAMEGTCRIIRLQRCAVIRSLPSQSSELFPYLVPQQSYPVAFAFGFHKQTELQVRASDVSNDAAQTMGNWCRTAA